MDGPESPRIVRRALTLPGWISLWRSHLEVKTPLSKQRVQPQQQACSPYIESSLHGLHRAIVTMNCSTQSASSPDCAVAQNVPDKVYESPTHLFKAAPSTNNTHRRLSCPSTFMPRPEKEASIVMVTLNDTILRGCQQFRVCPPPRWSGTVMESLITCSCEANEMVVYVWKYSYLAFSQWTQHWFDTLSWIPSEPNRGPNGKKLDKWQHASARSIVTEWALLWNEDTLRVKTPVCFLVWNWSGCRFV